MNRQILASMNEICNELEDLGLYKSATEITEMMVRMSQRKPWPWEPGFMDELRFQKEYTKLRDNNYKKGLPPPTPQEVVNLMESRKTPTTTPQSSSQSIFKKSPPLGYRVEFGKTEGMTDDELVIDYVALTRRAFEKNDLDKVGYWEDQAQENLSQKAYEKFSKIDEKMHDQFSNYYSEHPEAAEKLRTLKPGTSETSTTPEVNSSGLDRWVNKAENIYKAWSDKNMPENSTAPLLIKDVMNYMIKVKSSLPQDKLADAQAKIDKVQSFIDNINKKIKHTGSVAAYSTMTGFGKKESDVFGGQKLDEKKLDYLAKQESKSY